MKRVLIVIPKSTVETKRHNFVTRNDYHVPVQANGICMNVLLYTPKMSSKIYVKKSHNYISKRFMMSQINMYRRAGTQLTRPLLPSYSLFKPQKTYPPNRPYAIYSVNNPDKKSSDPQALINNPPTLHPEIYRQRCDQPGCINNICIGLCSTFEDRKAVAHATHGNPPKEPGKKVISLSKNTDFKGKPKPQNAVVYDKAHNVGSTPEDVQATTTLHTNNANLVQKIKKHEDTQ